MDGNLDEKKELKKLNGKITIVPKVDKTLTKEGCAADAKATGEEIEDIKRRLDALEG